MTQYRALFAILALAAFVRLALFAVVGVTAPVSPFIFGDGFGYQQISTNLLQCNGYSLATSSPYLPDSIRTPILPILLAGTEALFESAVPYVLFQIVLAVAIVYLTYRVAFLVLKSERSALWAAALMSFEPFSIFINLSILTETLFAFFITAGMYYLLQYVKEHRAMPLAITSALAALAALTRPIAEFLPLPLIFLVLCRETWRSYPRYLAAAIIPFLLVSAPWLIRNYQTFGIASFSSGGLQNVYSDLGATIISYRDGTDWRTAKNALEDDFAVRHRVSRDTIQQNLALSPVLFREGIMLMLQNPAATITSFISVAIAFLTNDSWSFYAQMWGWVPPFSISFSPTHMFLTDGPVATFTRIMQEGGAFVAVSLAGRIFWVIMTLLFLVGVWSLFWQRGDRRIYATILLVGVLYYLGLSWSAGAGVNGRYRYPVDPLIFTGVVAGWWYLYSTLRRMIRRRQV